jgi:cellulose synthase/poly-beta-1,6-N-acetylglucosamine synthase-like glycosyltransferase
VKACDEPGVLTGDEVQAVPGLMNGNSSSLASIERAVSVCVVCCSTRSMPHDVIHTVSKALSPIASVHAILLSESAERPPGVDVVAVPHGTKLSKIRRLTDLIEADLVCICDPDLTVDEDACRLILGRAAAEIRNGNDVVAFGIVEGSDDGTMLSRVIALDKWLSHRVLRRFLWQFGVGITVPGQFLIVSSGLLRRLDPGVDSYLDDLYLGRLARRQGVRVQRVPVVVGAEEPRTNWSSLLTQRVRWMRGLACLFGHLAAYPSALFLLSVHYVTYHGLPILMFFGVLLLAFANPICSLAVFLGLAFLLARLSRQSVLTAAIYMGVFPALHVFATLLWWIPVGRSLLARR